MTKSNNFKQKLTNDSQQLSCGKQRGISFNSYSKQSTRISLKTRNVFQHLKHIQSHRQIQLIALV